MKEIPKPDDAADALALAIRRFGQYVHPSDAESFIIE